MSAGSWALLGLLLLAAAGYVVFLYRRREVAVPGRVALGSLRLGALAVLLLLALDPRLPSRGIGRPASTHWVLVDRSLSMESDAGSPAARAAARARELAAAGGTVVHFGGSVRRPAGDADAGPADARSLLAPALERAAESGATRVTVLGDLRVEDPAAARAVAGRAGLAVGVEDVGGRPIDAGVAELRMPRTVEGGSSVPAEVTVFAAGETTDSLTLEVREEDRLVASRRIPSPPEGRRARVALDLPAPSGTGAVRYAARVIHPADQFPRDDERIAWVDVDPQAGNLVLVSEGADWEPRFLLPVLARVTGLPARGFLRVGPDRYVAMDAEGGTGTVPATEVAAQVGEAELLVVHGLHDRAPAWLLDGAARARRSVVFPTGPEGAAAAGVPTGPARPGEWYVIPDPPPSPIAAELAGLELRGLAPVTGLLPVVDRGGTGLPAAVALRARRGGAGPGEPLVALLSTDGGGRRAVVLGRGLWRWAFRGPGPREAYRRVWAGVAGWLLAAPTSSGDGVRPVSRVVASGEPLRWQAPGTPGDSVGIALTRGDSTVLDTTMTVPESGAFETPPLPAGTYAWRGTVGEGGNETAGRLDVEAWSAELLHPRALDLAADGPGGGGRRGEMARGRPLRTHPLPWLLALGLLCAEWIGRRRRGLR